MVLRDELEAKEQLKELLLKQKAQLLLILCFYRYTGVAQLEEYVLNTIFKDKRHCPDIQEVE